MADLERVKLDFDPADRFVVLRRELGVTSFGINMIVMKPGQRSRIHRHERQEEVYLVLGGELTLLVEEEEVTFVKDELVRVPAEVRRQLLNKGSEDLALLALGGHGEHQGRDAEAFTSWDQEQGAGPKDVPVPDDLPDYD